MFVSRSALMRLFTGVYNISDNCRLVIELPRICLIYLPAPPHHCTVRWLCKKHLYF